MQMQLSKKQNSFSQFFPPFLKCTFNFKYFKNKMTLIADVFPKLQAAKDVLPQMPKSPRFRTPCDSQHVNGSETLVKSA